MAETVVDDFTVDRLDSATELFIAVFNAPPWNDRWTHATAKARLADVSATPGFVGTVVEAADALVGFAIGHVEHWYSGEHFLLQEMCVRSDHRRRGLGRLLISELTARMPEVEQIYLLTDREGSAAAFYERLGFRPACRQGVMTKRSSRPS